jgi:hypothetical protein
MARSQQVQETKEQSVDETSNGAPSATTADPVASNGPLSDEQTGANMWQALMTPGEGATFEERWSHLTRYYIGAYGSYRVIKEVPAQVILTGKEAVAYALSEIPTTDYAGEPVSFFDAIAKAAKGKPHNARRNFGEELFDKMVESFVAKYSPLPDGATRSQKNEKLAAIGKGFKTTPFDHPNIARVDTFLRAEANALRDSEDMRRKVKVRGGKDKPDASGQAAETPTIDVTALLGDESDKS